MRILFLSRWFPSPPDNGSKIRIFNLLRELAVEHEVRLVALAEPNRVHDRDAREVLGQFCSSVRVLPHRPFVPASQRAIAGLLSSRPRFLVDTHRPDVQVEIADEFRRGHPDLVIASQLDMLPYALDLDAPRLLEELEVAGYLDACKLPLRVRQRLRAKLTWFKLSRYLRSVLPRFAACTVVSEAEKGNLQSAVGDYDRVTVIPNAVDLDQYQDEFGPAEAGALVFSGALTYGPNLDAASYFVGTVYPSIQSQVPDAHLRITGRFPAMAAGLGSNRGVELTDHLVDVRPTIARSAVAVVPVRAGGGTRLKILEAMALGTPVVSTTKGAEGLEVTHGEDILLADRPDQFASAVVSLLQNRALRDRISAGGRRLVESRYHWGVVGADIRSLLARVASQRSAVESSLAQA